MSITKIIWKYFSNNPELLGDTLYLNRRNIYNIREIIKKYDIPKESVSYIEIQYLLDKETKIRSILKECDYLLAIGGNLKIKSSNGWINFRQQTFFLHSLYLRSYSQVKHEFSISTQKRYKQINELSGKDKSGINTYQLVYNKLESYRQEKGSSFSITFGIITNGKNDDGLKRLVNSIVDLNIVDYEIVICGGTLNENFHGSIRLLDDICGIDSDLRAPITSKKNLICENAKYENILLLHDRFYFPKEWYRNMVKYGDGYDVLIFPNLNENGRRINDYTLFKGNPGEINMNLLSTLRYSSRSNSFYIPGGAFLIKKYWYNKVKLDENVFWQELEDIQFTKLLLLKGALISMDVSNPIFTESNRLGGTGKNVLLINIKEIGLRLIFAASQFLRHEYFKRRG